MVGRSVSRVRLRERIAYSLTIPKVVTSLKTRMVFWGWLHPLFAPLSLVASFFPPLIRIPFILLGHYLPMKTTLLQAMALLCLVPWQQTYSLQLPFLRPKHNNDHAHSQSSMTKLPSSSETLTPYTTPWVNELQALYNTFGEIRNDSSCPTEIQDWTCSPYPLSELDLIPPKDVWHLRPHVRPNRWKKLTFIELRHTQLTRLSFALVRHLT